MASITRFDAGGVAIFAPAGAGAGAAGGISYADYEYEADLASAGTYTPPASTFFTFFTELLGGSDVNLEWYNAQTTSWMDVGVVSRSIEFMRHQSASQRLRLINNDGANAYAIGLYGATWTGFTDYEYEADLASAGTTYTPPVKTFFTVFGENIGGYESLSSSQINVEWYDAQNTSWVSRIDEPDEKHLLHQSANQRLRVINDWSSALAIGLYGATW